MSLSNIYRRRYAKAGADVPASLQQRADAGGHVLVLFRDGHVCELGRLSNIYAGGGGTTQAIAFPTGWAFRERPHGWRYRGTEHLRRMQA